ncbi:putative porin [Paraburkholderia unamae]|uniref:porin n=1 Tax=Paraburkholderia unamae TaxID=219649 RepID=UPI000DC2AC2C|nr:porin [Paraburkholderia unamae]RAR54552.1 putative porin [Paraburkholderia unamae]
MKKTLATLAALSSVSVVAHAQQSITLYGIVDADLNYINHVGVAQTPASAGHPATLTNRSLLSQSGNGYQANRWGLKGSEDLGGGNKAFFQLENGFSINTGAFAASGSEFNRQAFVGLSNARYGTVSLGRQYDAMFDLVVPYGPCFYFGSYVSDYAGDISEYDGYARVNNAIKYRTPTFGGVTGEVLYALGGVAGSLSQQGTLSAALQYDNGTVGVGIGYLRSDNSDSPSNTWNGTTAGNFASSVTYGFAGAKRVQLVDIAGVYRLNALLLGLNYGYVNYTPSGVSLFKRTLTYNSVGASAFYQITPELGLGLGWNYTRGTSIDGIASRPYYEAFTVSSNYNLSKRTMLYAAASYQASGGKTLDAYGNIVTATASIGDSATGFSSGSTSQFLARMGIRHLF